MKRIKGLLVVVLLVVGFTASAQFKFGVGGGLNIANLGGSDISGTESILGYNGGFMAEVKLPIKLGVEADLLFSTKGASLGKSDLKLSYIDLPVVMKIYMVKILSFQLGAQYSMLVKASADDVNIKEAYKSNDLSAVLGLGIDVLKLHASARYNYGLSSIDDIGEDIKNNMFTFTVGVWIK